MRNVDAFIVHNGLTVDVGHNFVKIEGRLNGEHGLFLDVQKMLDFNEAFQVRTCQYAYHAGVSGIHERPIFRYDNHDQKAGHADRHHCHQFDPVIWTEIKPCVWVGEANWPHLSDAIDDLIDWWNDIGCLILPE